MTATMTIRWNYEGVILKRAVPFAQRMHAIDSDDAADEDDGTNIIQ